MAGGKCILGPYSDDWEDLASRITSTRLLSSATFAALFLFFYTFNQLSCALMIARGFKKLKVVKEIGSCCSSLVHCTVICVLTYQELCSMGWGLFSYSSEFDLAGKNTSTGIVTIMMCTSYMLADLTYLYRFSPEDTLYIVHHWATVIYMGLCLIVGRGHLSVMLCIFLGEVTNPLNNGMILSNLVITETGNYKGTAGKLNYFFACCLAVGFVILRAFYAPYGICWLLAKFYLFGGAGAESIPLLIRLVWVGLPILLADVRSGKTSLVAKQATKQA